MKRFLAPILALALCASLSDAATWHVEKDGSGDFAVIQDALDAAASGDTIRIGPGRFNDYRLYPLLGGDYNIIANVVQDEMTIIGAGAGATIIGPDTPGDYLTEPFTAGIFDGSYVIGGGQRLVINDVCIEHQGYAIYFDSYSTSVVRRCLLQGGHTGIRASSSVMVSTSEFRDLEYGLLSYAGPDTVSVVECEYSDISDTGIRINYARYGIVRDTVLRSAAGRDNTGIIFVGCAGGLYNTRVEGFGIGFGLLDPQLPTIRGNFILGGDLAVYSNSEAIYMEENVLQATGGPVVSLHTGGWPHRFKNNHIIRSVDYAVEVYSHGGPDGYHLDMTGNWWGTTNTDSISAYIYDGYDDRSLPIECFVDFEPFLGGPVPAEKKSLGGLKALFR